MRNIQRMSYLRHLCNCSLAMRCVNATRDAPGCGPGTRLGRPVEPPYNTPLHLNPPNYLPLSQPSNSSPSISALLQPPSPLKQHYSPLLSQPLPQMHAVILLEMDQIVCPSMRCVRRASLIIRRAGNTGCPTICFMCSLHFKNNIINVLKNVCFFGPKKVQTC